MEPCSPVTIKKLFNMAREAFFSSNHLFSSPGGSRSTTRAKLMAIDLGGLLVKRGKTLRKSLNDAVSTSHDALSCRPRDWHSAYVSPVPILEYEFSCSSSPPRVPYTPFREYCGSGTSSRRCRDNRRPLLQKRRIYRRPCGFPLPPTEPPSEVASSATGGFDAAHVDRAAEEFIQRFYRQLRLQKWMMAQAEL